MERISVHQFMILSAGVALGTTFLPVTQFVTTEAGRDGWWCILPGYLVAFPFALLIFSLAKRFPGKNLIEISENFLGKWPTKGIGIIYTGIGVSFGSLLLAQVGDTFKRTIMPLTPNYAYLGTTIILVILLAWAGIEVFARFNEVVLPIVILSLIATMLFSISRFEWDQFFPILANGIRPLLSGILKIIPLGFEYIVFLAGVLSFIPRDEESLKKIKNGSIRALIIVGLINTLITLVQILVFGPNEAKRLNYGLLSLGKMVVIGETVAGIESLFMMFWMGAMIIKVCAFYFIAIWGLRTVFKTKDELKWYLMMGSAFLGLAFLADGAPRFLKYITIVDNYLILPFSAFWVITLWGIDYWKKKGA